MYVYIPDMHIILCNQVVQRNTPQIH